MAFGRLKVDELETSTQTVNVDALVGIAADGDKGDITVSGSGTVWSIDDGAVDTAALGGDITAAGKALLDDADAAAQRTTLGAEAAGTAASAISTHEAAADPHPGYALESSLATVATTGALDDLGDVDLTTTPPADGEALVYDSATGDWVPGAAGGGTPGGTTGQLQWNSSGSFAGVGGSTVGASGDITLSANGAASTGTGSAFKLTGSWYTGANPVPQALIQPAGTATSTTWSTSGTGLGVNAPSGFAGNLLDLQVDGASRVSVSSGGVISTGVKDGVFITGQNGSVILGNYDNITGTGRFQWSFPSAIRLGLSAPDSAGILFSTRTVLVSETADTLAQRNGTNAQTYRLYNTYTDASNYERAYLRWASNVLEIGTEGAGTGSEKPVRITAATLKLPNLPTYADNAAATSGGLVAGDVYKTATGELRITV